MGGAVFHICLTNTGEARRVLLKKGKCCGMGQFHLGAGIKSKLFVVIGSKTEFKWIHQISIADLDWEKESCLKDFNKVFVVGNSLITQAWTEQVQDSRKRDPEKMQGSILEVQDVNKQALQPEL